MPYVKKIVTVRVNLKSDAHYWVQWKPIIRYGDVKAATVSSITVDEKGKREVDNSAAADNVILAHIEDWNLDDESGNKLPINAASLALLEDRDVDQLTDLLAAEATVEEKKRKN